MNNDIMKFYEYLATNTKLQVKLQTKLKNIKTKKEFEDFISIEIMPLANEKNYKFTQEDLINYEKENIKHLVNEDLINISGGLSPKSLILSGSLFSLILLGSGAFSGTAAHAVLPKTVIKNSADVMAKTTTVSNNENIKSTKSNQDNNITEQIEPTNSKTDDSQILPSLTEENFTAENPQPNNDSVSLLLSTNINKSSDLNLSGISQKDDNLNSLEFSEDSQTIDNNSTKVMKNYEPIPGQMSTQTVMGSSVLLTESLKQPNYVANMIYITDVLNLLDPYIYNISGTTEQFRFFDGNKTKITVGKPRNDTISAWEFNKDEGEGSPNFMRCLFPSSAGTLNVEGGNFDVPSFSRDCNPSPEMIACIAGYLYNYVRCENAGNVKKAKQELDYVINILKKSDKNKYQINRINKFFKNYLKYDLDYNATNNDTKKVQTCLYLIKNATHMIQNQEIANEKNLELRVLPKYITEKMLMCHFIQHFNQEEDVIRFYNKAKEVILINKDNDYDLNLAHSMNRIKIIYQIVNSISHVSNCPYNGPLVSNGNTQIVELTSNNKLKFKSDIFADCADTVIRHIINLLSYDDTNQWSFILEKNDNNKLLDSEINKILNAIKENNEIDKKSLKERIILFFYYQKTKGGADIASQEDRTFWNYVISNMDNESTEYPYKIIYCRQGNELKSGWINCLKSTYNILYALKSDDPNFKDKLTDAKKQIDNLIKNFSIKVSNNDLIKSLQDAILTTFGIITTVKIDEPKSISVSDKSKDIFSEINISKYDKNGNLLFSFPISHMPGHSQIDYSPCTVNNFNKNENNISTFISQDSVVQLLANTFNITCEQKSLFNEYFGPMLKDSNNLSSNSFLTNYNTLKFLKYIQGEGNNTDRIMLLLTSNSIAANNYSEINVFNNKKNNIVTLSQFIFDNYIKNKDHILHFFNIKNGNLIENNKLNKYATLKIMDVDNKKFLCKIKSNETLAIFYIGNDIELVVPKEILIDNTPYIVSEIIGTTNNNLTTIRLEKLTQKISICENAFENYKSLTTFKTAKSTVDLSIGKNAFLGCIKLKDFAISNAIASLFIDKQAFYDCQSLNTFSVPNINPIKSLYIGQLSFNNCGAIETFNISGPVKDLSIENEAFLNCTKLTKFNILNSTDSLCIGDSSFKNCELLEEFKVPANLTYLFIGKNSFEKCSSLKKFFTINNLKIESLSISSQAFSNCSSLTEFNIFTSSSIKSLSIGTQAFENCISLNTFLIPNNIKIEELSINSQAFLNCSSLTMFNIPNNSQIESLSIGNQAFEDCIALNSFFIPNNIKIKELAIGDQAFFNCSKLTNFNIPDNSLIKSLTVGKNAFTNCLLLNQFNIPNSITSLTFDDSAFAYCKSLQEFNIPKCVSLLYIGSTPFFQCHQPVKFNIPNSVKSLSISPIAFWHCEFMEKPIIPNSVTSLTILNSNFPQLNNSANSFVPPHFNNIFENSTENAKFNIPLYNSTTPSIGNILDGISLSLPEIPSSVTSLFIADNAFNGASNLKKFNVPSSISSLSIGNHAFDGSNIEIFNIPNDTQLTSLSIGNLAFSSCNHLRNFKIPPTVTTLFIDTYAFYSCSSLIDFEFSSNNLISSFEISKHTFDGCSSLINFNILKNNINSLQIGRMAFKNCSALEKFDVPDSVTNLVIDDQAFFKCSSLTNFNMPPKNIKSLHIGNLAFRNCQKLEKFNIPNSVTNLAIDEQAFFECSSLSEFNILCPISQLSIGKYAFFYCRSLSKINIPDDLLTLDINKHAFDNCTSLTEFNIPKNIKSLFIGKKAFFNCNNLSICKLDSVDSLFISDQAFEYTKIDIKNII